MTAAPPKGFVADGHRGTILVVSERVRSKKQPSPIPHAVPDDADQARPVALPAHRGARYAAISEKLIEGVELGTEALVESVRQGLIKGRDLAIVVGIMVDKLGAIEDRSGGGMPPASLDELEKRVALLMAAQAELKRRRREPIDVTPQR